MTVADAYLSTQVLTASPYRLHLMVVEGAIQFARFGAQALDNGEAETAHLALSKSRDFVTELLGGLKDEYDRQLTARMKQLFFFAYVNLVEGESDRDPQKVRDALLILTKHHETWLELASHLKPAPPADAPSAQNPAPSRAWSA